MKNNDFINFDKQQRDRFMSKLLKVSDDYAGVVIERAYIEKRSKKSLENFRHFLHYEQNQQDSFFKKILQSNNKEKKTRERYFLSGYSSLDSLSEYHLNIAAQSMLLHQTSDGVDLAYSYAYLKQYNYLNSSYIFFENKDIGWKPTLRYPERRTPLILLFLSLIFKKTNNNEPLVHYLNRVEDEVLDHEEDPSEDMPYFQFGRWLMLFTLTQEKPTYVIKSALFSSVIDNWDDDKLFLQSIINILDHHLAECMELKEAEREFIQYHGTSFALTALWREESVLPLEILALRQLRLDLGLYWPTKIEHPLMFDGLYDMVNKASTLVDKLNNELLETIQEVLQDDSIPTELEIVQAIDTVPLYEPDDDW